MYPSIKFALVRKAVKYFTNHLNEQEKKTVDTCLKLIYFSMSSTLLTFQEMYYKNGSERDAKKKSLAISGYELFC